jgi:putative flippase GtrA
MKKERSTAAGHAGPFESMGDRIERHLPTTCHSIFSLTRLGQFLLVGGLGAVIDTGSLFVIVETTGVSPPIAAFGSKEFSIAVMFVINDRWTFGGAPATGSKLRRFLSSNAVRVVGVVVGVGVLTLLIRWTNMWYPLANVLGICVGFVFNYIFENVVTWRRVA